MKKLYIMLLFLCLFINDAKSQEIATALVVYSKVDKTQVKTGDTIQYEINIDYDKRIKPEIPDIKKNLEDFSIVEEINQSPKNIDNRLVKTFVYKIQAKQSGAYIIQPVIIKYSMDKNLKSLFSNSDPAKTSKIYIDVKSILKPEDKNKDIEDIKDIENISTNDYFKIILYVVIGFILGFLIFLGFKKFRKNQKELLAHEWAFKEIDNLKKDGINQKAMKPFYFKISEILRIYLEKRFMINALQMTNIELEKSIINNPELDDSDREFIKLFNQKTDFYKYTDNKGDYENLKILIENVNSFVEKTKKIVEKK